MIRRLLRWIGRAIATYNPAPLDWPTDYDLGRGTLYVSRVDEHGKPTGKWIFAGHTDYFRIRTVPDCNGGRACEVCRHKLYEGQCLDCDLKFCPFNN